MRATNKLRRVSINLILLGLLAFWGLFVAPKVSAQTYDFDEGLAAITKGLVSENRDILKNKKIAVFGIIESKSGKKWEISSHIEDGIVDALVRSGYRVIERRRIQDVIQKELKKSTDLWFDQARIAQFGKLIGADFVVTGRYVLWGGSMLKLSIRAINVADGEIVAADKVKVHTDRIANLLKPIEGNKRVQAAKVSPKKPVKVRSIRELTHESGNLGEYKALIIGINDYEGPKIPDLETAINDATGVAKVLKEKYGFKVKLLLDRKATKGAIYRELRNLTVSTKANDSVLIYFAGHGDLDRTYDGGWWIPADATGGNPLTYLDNVQVQKAMRSMKARHVILVSDSCYSGTLFGKARNLPPIIDDKYYLSLYNERSRWGMTSGNKTPVSDQGTSGHSVFAYQLIKELRRNDKPFLSAHELYTRIAPVIANNSEQTPLCRPIVNTGDNGGEFVFVASVRKELPPTPTIPKVHRSTPGKEEDMLFWNSVRNSNDPALFSAYLKTFPDGIFVLIAKQKIETFKQKRRAVSTPPVVLKPKLFVEVEPKDAKVRVLNIVLKFHQGMALDPGRYHTEVSRNGYKTEKMWVKLKPGRDATLRFSLERKSVPQTNASLKQKKGTASVSPVDINSKLFVEVEPKDARVRILNIGLKFHQGMALDPGRYHTEVSRNGYKTEKMWVKLKPGRDATLCFSLDRKSVPQTNAPRVHQSTLNKDMLFWNSVQNSNDPALFSAYLKTFPNGIFVPIAKQKIEALKQKKRAVSTPPVVLKPKLFVEVEPKDARVRILNIGLKFHQGIALDPGRYHTEVSRNGYKTEKMWVKLKPGRDATLRFSLERKSVPQVGTSIKLRLKHSTPVKPSSDEYQRDNRHEDAEPDPDEIDAGA